MLQRIGRYQITGELGKGAMGLVYRALDPNIGRMVALKTMRVDVHGIDNEEMLRRFRNEARAAGVLNHPNIVTIYDAGDDAGLFYIAMEFVLGQTLQAVLNEKRVLPAEQAIDIARQVALGLDFAHQNGIVHRDIKPANIMIAPDKTAKIMDFGIAKGNESGMTSSGEVLGTPSYMSPEQVKGLPLDGRSDLFSLAVILYEMITGEKPFTGQNVTTIVYKIVHEKPIAPGELDNALPPALSAVVTRMLSKRPDERFQTGAEVARELEGCKAYEQTAKAAAWATGVSVPSDPDAVLAAAEQRLNLETTKRPAYVDRSAVSVRIAPRPVREASGPPRSRWVPALVAVAVLALAIAGFAFFKLRQSKAASPVPQPEQAAPVESSPTAQAGSGQEPMPEAQAPHAETQTVNEPPAQHSQTEAAPTIQPAASTDPVRKPLPLKAVLEVNSIPEGADILVDGLATGRQTPARLSVDGGRRTLTLFKDGYRESKATVNAPEGKTLRHAPTLEPLSSGGDLVSGLRRIFGGRAEGKGVLMVRTQPRGARIFLDGTPVPTVTPARLPIQSGSYKLSLRRPGFKPVDTTVVISRGETVQVDQAMERM